MICPRAHDGRYEEAARIVNKAGEALQQLGRAVQERYGDLAQSSIAKQNSAIQTLCHPERHDESKVAGGHDTDRVLALHLLTSMHAPRIVLIEATSASPATGGSFFGSKDKCVERHAMLRTYQAALPHAGMTPDAVSACAASGDPDDCDIHGDLPDRHVCALDAQCASGNCNVPRGAACGICDQPRPTLQLAACQNDACGRGYTCLDGKCYAKAKLGERCVEGVGCERGSMCEHEHGKCVRPQPSPVPKWIQAGERCHDGRSSRSASYCMGTDSGERRCVALDLGASCDDTFGNPCTYPSWCIDHVCALHDLKSGR